MKRLTKSTVQLYNINQLDFLTLCPPPKKKNSSSRAVCALRKTIYTSI